MNSLKNKIKFPKFEKNKIDRFLKKLNFNGEANDFFLTKDVIKIEKQAEPYVPEIYDLYFLYEMIKLNKRINVLEFGSGWSTLALSVALDENKKNYQKEVIKDLRFEKPFKITTIDNEKKYLKITKSRIEKFYKSKKKNNVNFHYSEINMCKHDSRFCHEYVKLPLTNPDFIYLDGPDQFSIKKNVNGFNIKIDDLMPMSLDIIKLEFFLVPGTIIVVDGRGANVQFLQSYFKRKWLHYYYKLLDMHILYLDCYTIGPPSEKLLEFYNK